MRAGTLKWTDGGVHGVEVLRLRDLQVETRPLGKGLQTPSLSAPERKLKTLFLHPW